MAAILQQSQDETVWPCQWLFGLLIKNGEAVMNGYYITMIMNNLNETIEHMGRIASKRPMKGTLYYFLDDVNEINKAEWSNCMRDDKRLKANNVHLTIESVHAEQEKRNDN